MTRPRPIRTAAEHAITVPRTARYYVLGDESASAEELWIVLHGFGQLAGDFIEYFSVLNAPGRLVIAPEALNRYYTVPASSAPASERPVGATWMTREDREREIADYVRYLDRLCDSCRQKNPTARVNVIGFSQGAATAMRWALLGSAPIDRLILWGATLPPEVEPKTVNERLNGARLTLVVGRTDQYISPDALQAERARMDASGMTYDLLEYDAGHSIKRAVLLELAAMPPLS